MFIPEVIQKNKPEYDESLKKSMGQTFILGKVKELIHKNAYQYYALEYLKSKSLRLDQETITLFNQYIKDFPENTKIQYFQEIQNIVIPDIQAFYADGKGGLNPRITVLDDSLQVTSYRQAVSHFKGNYLFIDIWASWCPDCIKEFAYNTELKSFLKKNDIACLYISLERSPDRAKWKRYLNKYNLIGSHILINDLLKNDLYQVLGTTSLWIPRYILVDPNGNIVLSEGALPSDGTKLYDQIFSKLSYVAQ
jgi:thiol-disulfide isomerase/thioredoxin